MFIIESLESIERLGKPSNPSLRELLNFQNIFFEIFLCIFTEYHLNYWFLPPPPHLVNGRAYAFSRIELFPERNYGLLTGVTGYFRGFL